MSGIFFYPYSPYPEHTMRLTLLIAITGLLLSACAAVDDSKKTITYDKALWKYETAIRWIDFGTANSLRRLEDNSAYSPDMETLQHIKVTSYNVLNKTTSEDHAEVRLTVEIIYYHDQSMKLITIIDNQIWKYDPEIKDWYITTPLPPFK
jgi:hypothetical protein